LLNYTPFFAKIKICYNGKEISNRGEKMLQDIIDSKNDSLVLGFLLAAPARSFSVLEVSRRLNIPHLKASHALNKLAAEGILKSFAKKGKKYYILNKRYKLLGEIKKYWQKEGPAYQDELVSALKKLGDVRAAFLSGIFCGHANLPVDILLVGKINLNKLANFLKAAEKLMGQEINYSIMTPDEFLQRRNTFDKFIRDIFDYDHLVIIDDLANRKKKRD